MSLLRSLAISALCLTPTLVLIPATGADASQCASRKQISGTWKADDQGTYVIRRLDNNTIWWMGESADDGRSWTNVFHGTFDGNKTIRGQWVDVKGWRNSTQSIGTLVLELQGTQTALNGFKKVGGSGAGFGGTRWFFTCG